MKGGLLLMVPLYVPCTDRGVAKKRRHVKDARPEEDLFSSGEEELEKETRHRREKKRKRDEAGASKASRYLRCYGAGTCATLAHSEGMRVNPTGPGGGGGVGAVLTFI